MKKTGTQRLRQIKNFQRPIQDGIKKYLLCRDCENKFSLYEKYFKEKVFDSYLNGRLEIENISAENFYFIVSVLWRVVAFLKDDERVDYRHKSKIDKAFSEWKDFLFNFRYPYNHCFYIYFVPDDLTDLNHLDRVHTYLHRSVDIEIAESDKICFAYAKFSRFILIGEIKDVHESFFENCNTRNKIDITSQQINFPGFWEYVEGRVGILKDYFDLPIKQQERNDNYFQDNKDNITQTDYWKALKRDVKK